MAITQQITQAPPAPQRSEPDTFADKADAFVAWLEGLSDELNTWASQANSTADEVNQNANDAETFKQQAEQARDYAYKWATEAEDTLVNDGVNPEGYSAYHYAKKSEEWYNKVATSQLWIASSNTSVEVGTGSKTFTLNETGRSFTIGSKIRIVATADPINVWMEGVATDYTDNNLTVDVGSANGSGTYSDWKISLNAGSDASSINGYTISDIADESLFLSLFLEQ